MTKKRVDLFESIQRDATPFAEDQAASSEPAVNQGQLTTVTAMVSRAMLAQHVPAALEHEFTLAKLSSDKVGLLRDEAMNLVSSEPFLREASNEIGLPRSGESEDDFVARAKEVLRALLTKLLKGCS